MPDSPSAAGTPGPISESTHRLARIEDWLHSHIDAWSRRHGRVPTVIPYTGYGSTERVRVLCRVLLVKPSQIPHDPPTLVDRRRARRRDRLRGWRNFISVPIASAVVTVMVGDTSVDLRSDRGGVLDANISVNLTPGTHTATISTPGGRTVTAPLQVVPDEATIGVVSDVDDTVMVTALPRPLLAAWNTFVLNEHARIPTPGMAVLFERIITRHSGTPVVYLSTGAWNVAPALSRFLSRNLYPPGPLLLTDWGPTPDRWFRSGPAHKRDNLARLTAQFPNMRWILVGDDGQRDEDVYRAFAAANPNRVAAVAIRQLSASEAVFAGGRSKTPRPDDAGVPWIYSPDGSGIAEQLEALGLL